MESYTFTVKYDDGSKEKHEIDAYVLSDAIKGFADFSTSLMLSEGSVSSAKSVVSAIRPGCVEVDFFVRSIFALGEIGFSGLQYVESVKSVISLFKALEGKPPNNVSSVGDGNLLIGTNNGNITINQNIYNNFVNSPAVGDGCDKFIRKPLKSGLENVSIISEGEEVSSIGKAQADSFQRIDFREHLHEYESTVWLRIIKPVLDGSAKWTFDNGNGAPIAAEIEDTEFLLDVKNGVHRFGNGDYLQVEMRSIQKRKGKNLASENIIEKVIKIERGVGDQLVLLGAN